MAISTPLAPAPIPEDPPRQENPSFRQGALIFTGWAVLVNLYYWLVGLSYLSTWQQVVAWVQTLFSRATEP